MTFHAEVMPPGQRAVLGRLGPLASPRGFSLGGGTAVAVRLGHRRSVDLDWFAEEMPEPLRLAAFLREEGFDLQVRSVDEGTLHGEADGVQVSFLEFRYPTLREPERWPEYGCRILTLADLACMKLSAVAGRGSKRDFIDLWAIGRSGLPLAEMLAGYRQKFGTEDVAHVLMSLAYFDDAEPEAMPEMLWEVGWPEVKRAIEGWIREYAGS